MKTLKLHEDTSNLVNDIIHDLKASEDIGILKCIQCGMCTSICPAARYTDYDPREIVKKVLDGDEEVVENDEIWNCFYCYTCHSICPVNNSTCEINQIIRQKSIDKGSGIERMYPFLAYGDSFLEFGIGSIPNNFFNNLVEDFGEEWLILKINIDDLRDELGLGNLILPKDSLNEVKDILKGTGFTERLDRIRRFKNESENKESTG